MKHEIEGENFATSDKIEECINVECVMLITLSRRTAICQSVAEV